VRFEQLPTLSTISIKNWAIKAQQIVCNLVTNGCRNLSEVALEIAGYDPVMVSEVQLNELRCFRWVNTSISNIKTAIKGSYDRSKELKLAQLYLAEPQDRLNSRFNLEVLLTRLLYNSIKINPRFMKWTKAAESCC
jgi:hypothetical protein